MPVNRCIECSMPIVKDRYPVDKRYCKHCYGRMERGGSDIETCFQGSVIIMED
mgnify:CR=1 FL=1